MSQIKPIDFLGGSFGENGGGERKERKGKEMEGSKIGSQLVGQAVLEVKK